MEFRRRTAILRITAMVALTASAILTADALNPGRAFCPLEAACSAARNSDLGSFFGVPTSVLGIVAFGGLFLLTLLPIEWVRHVLWPLGFLGGAAGIVFAGYQVFVLQSFCPLCLVADAAGFLAAIITLTWPDPPIRLSGKRAIREPHSSRAGWTLAASLTIVLPMIWPRPAEPAWVEIAPMDEATLAAVLDDEDDVPIVETAPVAQPAPAEAAEPQPVEEQAAVEARTRPIEKVALKPSSDVDMVVHPDPLPQPAEDVAPPVEEPAANEEQPEPPRPAPKEEPKPSSAEGPERAQRVEGAGPLVVEYLNAFCSHCRRTHKRLERVVASTPHPVRKRRIYTWGRGPVPLWARACAHAQTVGLEERMFAELMKARSQRPGEIYAAARRAGLDMQALQAAIKGQPSRRLLRDQRLVQAARLRVLPTLDIGRRRLQGEQSEAELRSAINAAAELLTTKP